MKNQETKNLQIFIEFYQKFNFSAVFEKFGAIANNVMAQMYPTNPNNNLMRCCCC